MIISSSIQCPFLFSFRCYTIYFPIMQINFISLIGLLLCEWKPQWQNFTHFSANKKLLVICYRHLKLGNWQPDVNLLHVTDQYFLLDCITCILFLIILQLGPYLRFWIGCMYSFYTFVKSYYWKQIFYVMSILCTFNM